MENEVKYISSHPAVVAQLQEIAESINKIKQASGILTKKVKHLEDYLNECHDLVVKPTKSLMSLGNFVKLEISSALVDGKSIIYLSDLHRRSANYNLSYNGRDFKKGLITLGYDVQIIGKKRKNGIAI